MALRGFDADSIEFDVVQHFDNALTFFNAEGLPRKNSAGDLHIGIARDDSRSLNAF